MMTNNKNQPIILNFRIQIRKNKKNHIKNQISDLVKLRKKRNIRNIQILMRLLCTKMKKNQKINSTKIQKNLKSKTGENIPKVSQRLGNHL